LGLFFHIMKKILLIVFVLISNLISAQSVGTLTHYYRVLPMSEKNIPKLCDSLFAQLFEIQIDRSLYDQGKIEIRKLIISDLTKVKFYAEFKQNKFTQIHYTARGKRNVRNLKSILRNDLSTGKVLIDKKRKFVVRFSTKCG